MVSLFIFLAPFVAGIIGGAIGGITAAKIMELIFIEFLTLDKAKNIANKKFPLRNLTNYIHVAYKDPSRSKECDIGLYNIQTDALEQCVGIKFSEMESSLKKQLLLNGNLLIIK